MASPPALFLNPGALVVRRADSGGASDVDDDGEEDLSTLEEFDNEEATGWPQHDPYVLLHTFTKKHHFAIRETTGALAGIEEPRIFKFENDRVYLNYLRTNLQPQVGFDAKPTNDWCTFNKSTVRFATDQILKELLYSSLSYVEALRMSDTRTDMFQEVLDDPNHHGLQKRPVYLLDGSNMFHTQDANRYSWDAEEQSDEGTFNPHPSSTYENAAGARAHGSDVTGFERYFDFDEDPGQKIAMYLKRRTEARDFFLHLLRRKPTMTKGEDGISDLDFQVAQEHYIFKRASKETPDSTEMRQHFKEVSRLLRQLERDEEDEKFKVYARLKAGVLDQSSKDAPSGPVVIVINEKSYNNIVNKFSKTDADKKLVVDDGEDNGELRRDVCRGARRVTPDDVTKVYFNTRDKQGKSLFYRVLETTAGLHKWEHPVVFSINDETEVSAEDGNVSNRDIGGNHSQHYRQGDTKVGRFVFHYNTPENPSEFQNREYFLQHLITTRDDGSHHRRAAVAGKFVTEALHSNKEWDDTLLSRVRDGLDRLGISAHSISNDKNVYKTDHPCLPNERCDDECLYPVSYDSEWRESLRQYRVRHKLPAEMRGENCNLQGEKVQIGNRTVVVPHSDDCDRVFDFMTILSQRMSRRTLTFNKNPPDEGEGGVDGLRNFPLMVHPYFTGVIRALQAEEVKTYPWTPYYGSYCVSKNTGRLRVKGRDGARAMTVADFVEYARREAGTYGAVTFREYPDRRRAEPKPELSGNSVLRGNIMRDEIVKKRGLVVDFDKSDDACKPDAPTYQGADARKGVRWVMEHRRHLLLFLRDLASSAEAIANDADLLDTTKTTLNDLAAAARSAANDHAVELKIMAMDERALHCDVGGSLRSAYVKQQREKHRRMRVLDRMRSTFDKGKFYADVERSKTDAEVNDVSPRGMIRLTPNMSWNFVFRMYHSMCERHAVPDADRHPFEPGDFLSRLATVTEMPITETSTYSDGSQVNAPLWYRDLRNWFAVYVFALARSGLARVEPTKTFLFEEDDIETGWPSFLGIVWPADRSLRARIDAAKAAVQRYYAEKGEVWHHNPVERTPGPDQTEAQGITPASLLAADTYRFVA